MKTELQQKWEGPHHFWITCQQLKNSYKCTTAGMETKLAPFLFQLGKLESRYTYTAIQHEVKQKTN